MLQRRSTTLSHQVRPVSSYPLIPGVTSGLLIYFFKGLAFNNRKKVLEFQIYLKGWPAFAQHLRHLSCQRLMVGSWNPAKF